LETYAGQAKISTKQQSNVSQRTELAVEDAFYYQGRYIPADALYSPARESEGKFQRPAQRVYIQSVCDRAILNRMQFLALPEGVYREQQLI
jgi:hypothetical protein